MEVVMRRKEPRIVWREGNQIELLRNGAEFFRALCLAIDAAQTSVHLETYIFSVDETGLRVLDCLRRACERGVKVRVVMDGFGSARGAAEISRRLGSMLAQYRIYRPRPRALLAFAPNRRRLRRLHRKTCVVDDRFAFVGGLNILDDLLDVPDDGVGPRPRFDFAVMLQGPIVLDVIKAQSDLWLRMAWRKRNDWAGFYRRLAAWSKRYLHAKEVIAPDKGPGRRAALMLRDNVRYRRSIEDGYLTAIDRARTEVLLANAYFFPGRRVRKALEHAAGRGVRVRLLLQGRSEYPLQYRACRSMYCNLLDDGIEIYEYMASYLHAKVAVIDSSAIVGSANLDPFSLLLAREANIFVQDAEFAAELKAALEAEMQTNARRITEEDLHARSFLGRFADAVSYRMLRIGVALTGRSTDY
jgi:cardiolipin synthase